MSPTTFILLIGVAALVALTLCLVYELRSALRRMTEAESERDRLAAARETDALSVEAFRRERDEALKAKSAQWEAWQAEATNLRADVAALNTMLEQRTAEVLRLRRECRDATDLATSAQRTIDAYVAEVALLRPIADSADALCDGKNLPGEFTALREAIRARREAS